MAGDGALPRLGHLRTNELGLYLQGATEPERLRQEGLSNSICMFFHA